MSHLVEIDNTRARMHGWGLKLPEVTIPGYGVIMEPITCQVTKREIRVTAYQVSLLNYLGVKNSIRDLTNAFQYLPDTCFVPIEDGSSAYGENKNHKLEYNQIKKSQHQWIINNVKFLLEEFNIDRFRLEWNKRLNIFPKTDMLIRLLTEAGRDLFRILLLIRN